MAAADRPGAPSGAQRAALRRAAAAKTRGRARSALYLASWGALALSAGLYLAAVTLKPQYLIAWFPFLDRVATQPQPNNQDRASIIAEAQHLRSNLQQSQAEVSRLRQELGTRDARVKSAELRIAGLEKELDSARGSGGTAAGQPNAVVGTVGTVPNAAAASSVADNADATKHALAGAIGSPKEGARTDARAGAPPRSFEIVNGAPTLVDAPSGSAAFAGGVSGADVDMPVPVRRPAIAPKPKTTPIAQIVRPTIAVTPPAAGGIVTGSVGGQATIASAPPAEKPAQPITFGAPVVTHSANPVGIRLTAGPSVDALRLSWSLMSERYGYELSGLEPRYIAGNAPAAPYALIAGPIADEREAQRRCALLTARGIPCSVDSFVGNAL